MIPLLLALTRPGLAASGLAGLSVPEPWGGFAGPSAGGAQGVASNPASARPESFEADAELGLLAVEYAWQLDGEEPVFSRSLTPVPALSLGGPLGPVGLGLQLGVPYSRGGAAAERGTPGALYLGESTLQVMAADLALAWRATPWLSVGAGLRLGRAEVASQIAYDTGVPLADLLGPEAGVPYQDPFLEGTETYRMLGLLWAPSLGVRLRPPRGPGVDLAARAPQRAHLSGPMSLRPSDDLEMVLEGQATLDVAWPAELTAALSWPRGRWRPGGELAYTGWSSLAELRTELHDLSITSDDEVFESLLQSYDLTQADFLDALSEVRVRTGMADTLSGGLWLDVVGEPGMVRAGIWVSPGAIPDAYLNPGNADFNTVDLRLAAAKPFGRWVAGLSLDGLGGPSRVVTESVYAQSNGGASGLAVPPAEGRYHVRALRVGLSLGWRAAPHPNLW